LLEIDVEFVRGPFPFRPLSSNMAGMSLERRGRIMLLTSALLWSTSGLFVKSPPLAAIPQDVRGPALACFRALAAAGVLALFVRPRHIRWRPMLVPFVISFAAMNFLFVTAMTRTTAAAASFLQYTSTVWAFLLSVFVLRERIDRANLVPLVCAVAGMWWIVAGDWTTANFFGNCLALGSGLAYAGVVISLKQLRSEDSAWLIALCHTAAGVVLLPIVLRTSITLNPLQWSLVILFGVVQMGLPYVIFARAMQYVSAQEAALITLIEPILNPIWVAIFWGETVGSATWIGGGLIVGGLAVRYLFFSRSPSEPAKR